MEEQNIKTNSPKFAFFYMLSLASLVFMAVSVGIILFQIINKNIVDILASYRNCYSSEALRFAISSIVISAPIYYILSYHINKNLFTGKLDIESGIRKWLIYFILLVSSIIIIGYLIAIVFNFLDGELTLKFIFKTLTALLISGSVFSYYLYDIKRKEVIGRKNKIVKIYFAASLSAVAATLIAGIFFVESPWMVRKMKYDDEIIERLNSIEAAVNSFYQKNKQLPENLEILVKETSFLNNDKIISPLGEPLEFKTTGDKKYELCAKFKTKSKDEKGACEDYSKDERWHHNEGHQCFERKATNEKTLEPIIIR